jgi:hypothetical protein
LKRKSGEAENKPLRRNTSYMKIDLIPQEDENRALKAGCEHDQ